MAKVRCEIVRWVDDQWPGWVEALLVDASGRQWLFDDKLPIFTAEHVWSDSEYPRPGFIRCSVIGVDHANGLVTIDTSAPDAVESRDGDQTVFVVPSHVVVED